MVVVMVMVKIMVLQLNGSCNGNGIYGDDNGCGCG